MDTTTGEAETVDPSDITDEDRADARRLTDILSTWPCRQHEDCRANKEVGAACAASLRDVFYQKFLSDHAFLVTMRSLRSLRELETMQDALRTASWVEALGPSERTSLLTPVHHPGGLDMQRTARRRTRIAALVERFVVLLQAARGTG